MVVLFEIGHPAHIHYFRNAANLLQDRNIEVYFCIREKDISLELIKKYNFSFFVIGKRKLGLFNKIIGTFGFTFNIVKIIRRTKADIIISFYSPYAAYAAFLCGIPSIGFADSEHAKFNIRTTYPFTTLTLTPKYFKSNLGKKHIKFNSFMELGYLHNKYYKPNAEILNELKVKRGEYVILRFVSWDAHHDIGQAGLNEHSKLEIIKKLEDYYKVFISSEGQLPIELERYRLNVSVDRMHDVLFYSSMFIGEGATMASECAMLGTPAIYVNSLDAGTLQEQERRGLIVGYRDSEGVIEKVDEWIQNKNLAKEVYQNKVAMIQELIDPTNLLFWLVVDFKDRIEILKSNPNILDKF